MKTPKKRLLANSNPTRGAFVAGNLAHAVTSATQVAVRPTPPAPRVSYQTLRPGPAASAPRGVYYVHRVPAATRFEAFSRVEGPTLRFELSEQLPVRREDEDALVVLNCVELGIISYGATLAEAQESFFEDFEMIWTQYSRQADSALAGDAVAVKRRLEALVSQVE